MSSIKYIFLAILLVFTACESLKSKNYELLSDKEGENNNPDLALEYLDKAIVEDPTKSRLYFKKALYLQRVNRFENALESINFAIYYAEIINLEYSQKAKIFYHLNNLDSSFYYHDLSIETVQKPEKALQARAETYFLLKNYGAALLDVNQSLEYNKSYLSAYFTRGEIFLNGLNNPKKAIEDFSKIINFDSKPTGEYGNITALAYTLRGIGYFKLEQIELACLDWEKTKVEGYEEAESLLEDFCK